MTKRIKLLPIVSQRGGGIFPATSLTILPRDGAPEIQGKPAIQAHVFASGTEFCAAIPEDGRAMAWHQETWLTSRYSEAFTGTPSMPAAKSLFLDPPKSLRDRAAAAGKSLTAHPPMRQKMQSWNIAGAYPSVARALSGDPRAMRAMCHHNSPKMVTLISNASIPWGIKADILIEFSVAMAAAVDMIEAAGWRAEVWASQISVADADFVGGCLVRLKGAEDAVDTAKLVAGLGHPSFLRRLCFGYASVTDALKPLGVGMGYATAILPPDDAPGTYCTSLSGAYDALSRANKEPTAQNFLAEIAATLARQGFAGFSEETRKERLECIS